MKIRIKEIVGHSDDIRIIFDSKLGRGIGFWKNQNQPVVGNEYDVEFNVEKAAKKEINTFSSQIGAFAFEVKDDYILITGTIENIDDDGLAYLRLSSDCIIMLETDKDDFRSGDCITLRSGVKDFHIYAQGL